MQYMCDICKWVQSAQTARPDGGVSRRRYALHVRHEAGIGRRPGKAQDVAGNYLANDREMDAG